MTDGYDCYQNALAERVNGIIKNEFLLQTPKNLEEAAQMIKESIHIYNHDDPIWRYNTKRLMRCTRRLYVTI